MTDIIRRAIPDPEEPVYDDRLEVMPDDNDEPVVGRRGVLKMMVVAAGASAVLAACANPEGGDVGGVVDEGDVWTEEKAKKEKEAADARAAETLGVEERSKELDMEKLGQINNLVLGREGIVATVLGDLKRDNDTVLNNLGDGHMVWSHDGRRRTSFSIEVDRGSLTVWKRALVEGKMISVKARCSLPAKLPESIDTSAKLRNWVQEHDGKGARVEGVDFSETQRDDIAEGSIKVHYDNNGDLSGFGVAGAPTVPRQVDAMYATVSDRWRAIRRAD